jgi:hypothetical protein
MLAGEVAWPVPASSGAAKRFPRQALNDKTRALRLRQDELTAAIEDQHASPTPAALDDIKAMLAEGLDDDAPIPRRKAVLNRLIAEIRIESPEAIYPTFKLPMDSLRDQTVRPLFRVVEREGVEPSTPEGALR